MGQYWTILNLDKRERLEGGKLGEDLFSNAYGDLFTWLFISLRKDAVNPTWSWAGDRIIYLGDYADDCPEGLLTEDEEKELNHPDYTGLYDFAAQRYKNASHWDVRKLPRPPWVLRNLTRHEYVHSDAVEIVNAGPDDRCVPGIMEALMIRLCWSSDGSLSMRYEARWPGIRPLYRGFWAGNRFDIIADSDFDVKAGWKNVSAAVRREMFTIWASEFGEDTVSLWKTKYILPSSFRNVYACLSLYFYSGATRRGGLPIPLSPK